MGQATEADGCNVNNFLFTEQTKTDGTGAAGKYITIQPRAMVAGTYVFTLLHLNSASQRGEATHTVEVTNFALAGVTVVPSWLPTNPFAKVSTQSTTESVVATVRGSFECPVHGLSAYSFAVAIQNEGTGNLVGAMKCSLGISGTASKPIATLTSGPWL